MRHVSGGKKVWGVGVLEFRRAAHCAGKFRLAAVIEQFKFNRETVVQLQLHYSYTATTATATATTKDGDRDEIYEVIKKMVKHLLEIDYGSVARISLISNTIDYTFTGQALAFADYVDVAYGAIPGYPVDLGREDVNSFPKGCLGACGCPWRISAFMLCRLKLLN